MRSVELLGAVGGTKSFDAIEIAPFGGTFVSTGFLVQLRVLDLLASI